MLQCGALIVNLETLIYRKIYQKRRFSRKKINFCLNFWFEIRPFKIIFSRQVCSYCLLKICVPDGILVFFGCLSFKEVKINNDRVFKMNQNCQKGEQVWYLVSISIKYFTMETPIPKFVTFCFYYCIQEAYTYTILLNNSNLNINQISYIMIFRDSL